MYDDRNVGYYGRSIQRTGMDVMKGYVQVYTGDGKGKSTAAFGLALRAAGAGLRVFIAQFAKGRKASEHKAFERFPDLITVNQYGTERFIRGKPAKEDIEAAKAGLRDVHAALSSGEYDVVILDEANIATHFGVLSVDEILDVIDKKPPDMELIITGRKAHERVIEHADLVTEMVEVKHYYQQGADAREGIEF